MSGKKWSAALLLVGLLPALLGGCFTVDIKVPSNGYDAAQEMTAQETEAATPAPPEAAQPQGGQAAGALTAMTTAEQLSYFNIAVNRIKAEKAGFKKSKLTATEDIVLSNSLANSLVSLVKGALLSETAAETVVNRGESSDAVMSPYNVPYVSQLTEEDVEKIDVVPAGGGYTVTVYVKPETNPEAQGSRCAKIFEFMTVGDVVNTYAPKVGAQVAREDVEVAFDGCYARATIDAEGNVTAYETFVKATMLLKNAKVRVITTDVTAVLSSTTRYTDFSY